MQHPRSLYLALFALPLAVFQTTSGFGSATAAPSGPAALSRPSGNPVCVLPAQEGGVGNDLLQRLQADDGRWPAALPGLSDDERMATGPGTASADLATTAAMLWALTADGNTTTKGPYGAAIEASVQWLDQRVRSGDAVRAHDAGRLLAGEAAAAYAVAALAGQDRSPLVVRADVSLRGILLATQNAYGDWEVDGAAAQQDSFDATVWATLTLALRDRQMDRAQPSPNTMRARNALREIDDSPLAATAALLLDLLDGGRAKAQADPETQALYVQRFDALAAAAVGDPASESASVEQDALLAAVAFHLGGTTWKEWSRGTLRETFELQRREGPGRGFWPAATDRRGALWELGCRLVLTSIYFRYSVSGLTD